MLKNKTYSYLLVISQFTCIALLIILNIPMFTSFFTLFIFMSGIGFFFYTIMFNKISNFNIIPDIKSNAVLVTSGPYKFIRHPMYFAVLVTMFAPLVSSFSIINISISIILIVTMFLKAQKEEYLWSSSSDEYSKYIKKTKMMIPFIL